MMDAIILIANFIKIGFIGAIAYGVIDCYIEENKSKKIMK